MLALAEVLKAKVCLIGEAGVGKTSLARRFVHDAYSDRPFPTLGANVSRKDVELVVDGRPVRVVLTIWDVTGERSFLSLFEDAWLARAQGVLAVSDLARPETAPALLPWIEAVRRVSGPVPIILLGNKADLVDAGTDPSLPRSEALPHLPVWRTSGKTGLNVEAAFRELAASIVRADLPGHDSRMRGSPEAWSLARA